MKIKVCGMKYPENIKEVVALKPAYLGFIFYKKSPRNFEGILPEILKTIKKVGVFVNEDIVQIVQTVSKYHLDAIQLHGDETPGDINEIKHELPDLEIIKVFGIKDSFDFTKLEPYENSVDYFLFDTKGKERGGNGVSFDWEILKNYNQQKPYLLSGGISNDAVEELISFLNESSSSKCVGVDINSKFEIEPGLKSVSEIQKFKNKLKSI